jgi:hypothetical protein
VPTLELYRHRHKIDVWMLVASRGLIDTMGLHTTSYDDLAPIIAHGRHLPIIAYGRHFLQHGESRDLFLLNGLLCYTNFVGFTCFPHNNKANVVDYVLAN